MENPVGLIGLVCGLPLLVLAGWGWLWFWIGRNYDIIIRRRHEEELQV
jgi:hypothetical protein